MPGILSIDPSVEKQPTSPAGENYPGKIVTAQRREMPGAKNAGKHYLDIGVTFKAPDDSWCFAHTRPFGGGNTSLEPNSNSRASTMVAQLGFNPAGLEMSAADERGNEEIPELLGTEVLVSVGLRTYEMDGETREQNFIRNLFKA